MSESGQSGGEVRCVVLAPEGVPSALSASLARRGVAASEVRDPFQAMADVLRASREESGIVTLLVVEPERVHRSAELMRAVERFAPEVNRWRYDADSEPKLRGYVLDRGEVTTTNGMDPTGGRMGFGGRVDTPPLRLAGADLSPAGASEIAETLPDEEGAEEEAARSARELLTDEELEMLLSDGPLPEDEDGGRP